MLLRVLQIDIPKIYLSQFTKSLLKQREREREREKLVCDAIVKPQLSKEMLS